jgi:hypothetical protein
LNAHKANKNIHRAAVHDAFKIVIINSNDIEEAQSEKLQGLFKFKDMP